MVSGLLDLHGGSAFHPLTCDGRGDFEGRRGTQWDPRVAADWPWALRSSQQVCLRHQKSSALIAIKS